MYYHQGLERQDRGGKKKGQTFLRFDPLKHTSATVAFKKLKEQTEHRIQKISISRDGTDHGIDYDSMLRFWQFLKN